MNRMFLLTSVLALGVFVSSSVVQAEDKDDKEPTIKGIMKATHAGDKALKAKVTKAAKAKDWETVETAAKEWVKHAEALSKTKATKGEAESWTKLTASYEKSVKDLEAGAEKKNAKAVNAAMSKINASCGACHKLHKGK